YMVVGKDVQAFRTAEKCFQIYGIGGEMLDDYCWIRRLQGQTGEALKSIDRGIADPLRRIERARVYAALKQWDKADADLDVVLSRPLDYHSYSTAWLMRGFLLEQKGAAADKVQEAWRQGLLKNWKPGTDEKGGTSFSQGQSAVGMPMLHDWIMASLAEDMTDADAEELLAGLISFAGKDNPVFNKMMRPSMLRETWRTPRGRDIARRIAFREIPFSDIVRYPLFLGWIAFLHEVCWTRGEAMSADQDELLWQMSSEIYVGYRDGILNERYFLPFGAIMAGNPHAPGMGWREIALMLQKYPKLRGPLGYICGLRYLKK